ncbi:MAG TPA: hypothetical protein VK857_04390 [Desulforhopalus sp.]|jgi:hypothetical protein|nr:hypothetical protein [Desulforhopalus sp.]
MVRFTVSQLGEHVVDNMQVSGPAAALLQTMVEIFLASYSGPADGDLDLFFAQYVIKMSYGQGAILEYLPPPPAKIH